MSDTKQKVLIVHNYYQIPGGEDSVVANEKKMLEEQGHEVILYTRHNSEMKTFSKIQKLLLPISTIFNVQTYKEVRQILKKEKINVMHVHNTLNLISPSIYYAGFAEKVPVVQTIHNFRLLCPGATFYRGGQVCEECLKKGLTCAVIHKCYRGSRLQTLACVISTVIHRLIGTYKKLNYICLTEFNKEKLLNLKQIQEQKVFVKPNFVQKPQQTVSYMKRKEQFIYVGRLEEIKGIDILLKAWKEMGECAPKLYLCGKGPLEEWCKQYISENNLSKIEMLGFVSNEKVREMVGESKALILPTQVYEGFPMTIAEAFVAGTPVIGSNLGNTGDLIENGRNGWKFEPKSSKELVRAVKNLQESFEGLDEKMMNKYSAENNYEQLRTIYETCCNHN